MTAYYNETGWRPVMPRFFISSYTDGPSTCWNVIDRRTQEWIRRFPTEEAAQQYADDLNRKG